MLSLCEFFLEILDLYLNCALCGICCQRRDLVVGSDHLARLGVIAMQVDRVKLAAGRAQAATDALILIDDRHAAAQAAACFRLYLIFGEGDAVVLHGLCLARIVLDFLAHGRVEAVDVDNDVVLIQLVEIARITGKGKALAGLNVAVQANRALAAGGYRVDSELRAGVAVAADEDILLCGLTGYGICHCNALCGGLERADIQLAPVDGLADSG